MSLQNILNDRADPPPWASLKCKNITSFGSPPAQRVFYRILSNVDPYNLPNPVGPQPAGFRISCWVTNKQLFMFFQPAYGVQDVTIDGTGTLCDDVALGLHPTTGQTVHNFLSVANDTFQTYLKSILPLSVYYNTACYAGQITSVRYFSSAGGALLNPVHTINIDPYAAINSPVISVSGAANVNNQIFPNFLHVVSIDGDFL